VIYSSRGLLSPDFCSSPLELDSCTVLYKFDIEMFELLGLKIKSLRSYFFETFLLNLLRVKSTGFVFRSNRLLESNEETVHVWI